MKRFISMTALLLALVMLTACGAATVSRPEQNVAQRVADAYLEVKRYSQEPVTPEHGEDYVIEWEDPGMEAHIRFLLDKPEGDILHSDVWDVQLLILSPVDKKDLMIRELPEGCERIEWDYVLYSAEYQSYSDREIPDVGHFRDLRHFDSLQVFRGSFAHFGTGSLYGAYQVTDLSGLEECRNLAILELDGIVPESLEPLAGVTGLQQLFLNLQTCVSLEPLTELPDLQLLSLSFSEAYPSLEPLTRTTVKYLDLSQSYFGRITLEDLDYESLAQMKELFYLDVSNLPDFDEEACGAILDGCGNLRHLNISYTEAADAITRHKWDPDLSSLISFEGTPS